LLVACAVAGFAVAEAGAQESDNQVDPARCEEPIDRNAATLRDRAAEHYQSGQKLYTLGEYERAIVEFREAYCLVPVAEAVHNVAQAHERLANYEDAVLWFEQYIRLLSADTPEVVEERDRIANRVAVLRRLPARIRVATEPPGARIALVGSAATVEGRANAKDPLRVPAGTYTMQVELEGYEPMSEAVVADIGQPYTYSFRLTHKTGEVRVSAEPEDARIFVDRKLVGVGGFVDRLPVGEHVVTVEAEGRGAETRTVTLSSTSATNVFVSLPEKEKSGRWELLTASTVVGLSAGSALGTLILGRQSTSDLTGYLTLVGGGIGFGGTYLGTPSDISVGSSSYLIGSAAWGTVEGLGLSLLFDVEDRVVGGIVLSTSVVFVTGAALSAGPLDLSAGDAALVNSGALWGAVSGLLFASAFSASIEEEPRFTGALLLAGTNAGLLTGATLARRFNISRGHAALIDLAGLAGLVTGMSLASSTGTEGSGPANFALAGMGGGLLVGAILTRNMDRRRPSAQLFSSLVPVFTVARTTRGDVPVAGVSTSF
jgi:hypothetical protein